MRFRQGLDCASLRTYKDILFPAYGTTSLRLVCRRFIEVFTSLGQTDQLLIASQEVCFVRWARKARRSEFLNSSPKMPSGNFGRSRIPRNIWIGRLAGERSFLNRDHRRRRFLSGLRHGDRGREKLAERIAAERRSTIVRGGRR